MKAALALEGRPPQRVNPTPARSDVKGLVALALCAIVCVRVYFAFTLPVDSDEPQHLHVAWAWFHGFVPYRDFFDNHAPLFQVLFSPLLAALGERADIVPLMRLAMIPLYCAALALTWYIGRALWSNRVGVAAALIVAALPTFFQISVEFRPDQLWMVLWLSVLAVVVSPLSARRKAALGGFLLGAAFAVSLKTVLLAASAGTAAVMIASITGWPHQNNARNNALIAALCALIVPCLIVAYLVHEQAWRAALYCLFEHNIDAGLGHWRGAELRLLVLLGWPACYFVLRRMRRTFAAPGGLMRAFVLLSAALYLLALYGAWPLVTHQDLLPVLPLVSIGIAVFVATPMSPPVAPAVRVLAIVLIASMCVGNLAIVATEDRDGLVYQEVQLQRILELTRSGDHVMDGKGLAIFRPRPIYWVLEGITAHRIHDGTITDNISAELAATSTPVVIADRLPSADRSFIERNYVCVDDAIYVAGQRLPPATMKTRTFTISVPLVYATVNTRGLIEAKIDGVDAGSGIYLARGTHTLESTETGHVAIVWAPALQRGLSPVTVVESSANPC